jgi:hypothetical protein
MGDSVLKGILLDVEREDKLSVSMVRRKEAKLGDLGMWGFICNM